MDPQQHPGIFFYLPASHAGVATTEGMLELVSSGTPSSMGGQNPSGQNLQQPGGAQGLLSPLGCCHCPLQGPVGPQGGAQPPGIGYPLGWLRGGLIHGGPR